MMLPEAGRGKNSGEINITETYFKHACNAYRAQN